MKSQRIMILLPPEESTAAGRSPGTFSGTGTPEADGVSFLQLLKAIRTVCTTRVVAADVNELAPMLDSSGVSTATTCKVLRELILALHNNNF